MGSAFPVNSTDTTQNSGELSMFKVVSLDDVVEDIDLKAGRVGLLAQGDGIDVLRQVYAPGIVIGFCPGFEGLEVTYVVSGKLSPELDKTGKDCMDQVDVTAGNLLLASNLTEPKFFRTVGEVVLLTISSRPTFEELSKHANDLMALAETLSIHDGYTADHCRRSKDLALSTAKRLGLSTVEQGYLACASRLHDIGKSRVPVEVLRKPGKLTPEEFEQVKMHPVYGREMVQNTYFQDVADIIEQHHERPDGRGYPRGLTKEQIKISAAVVSVIDAFDAMTSDRPYRKALPVSAAVAELRAGSGTQFFPEVVDAFIEVLKERGEL